MSLLDEARNAPTRVFRHHGRGIGQGITSESHRVEISTEARDALVELADAAIRCEETKERDDWYATVRASDVVRAALERLQR